MELTLSKCFSALVASGMGSKCNGLKYDLQENLLTKNESTGEWNSFIFKYGNENNPNIQRDLNNAVGVIVDPYLHDVDSVFFEDIAVDLSDEEEDAMEFQYILEDSMRSGYWNGFVGKS